VRETLKHWRLKRGEVNLERKDKEIEGGRKKLGKNSIE
jgi:hypothetical protein